MIVSAKEVCDVWRMTSRLEVGSCICNLILGPIVLLFSQVFWPNIEKGVILKVYFTPDPTLTIWRFGAF